MLRGVLACSAVIVVAGQPQASETPGDSVRNVMIDTLNGRISRLVDIPLDALEAVAATLDTSAFDVPEQNVDREIGLLMNTCEKYSNSIENLLAVDGRGASVRARCKPTTATQGFFQLKAAGRLVSVSNQNRPSEVTSYILNSEPGLPKYQFPSFGDIKDTRGLAPSAAWYPTTAVTSQSAVWSAPFNDADGKSVVALSKSICSFRPSGPASTLDSSLCPRFWSQLAVVPDLSRLNTYYNSTASDSDNGAIFLTTGTGQMIASSNMTSNKTTTPNSVFVAFESTDPIIKSIGETTTFSTATTGTPLRFTRTVNSIVYSVKVTPLPDLPNWYLTVAMPGSRLTNAAQIRSTLGTLVADKWRTQMSRHLSSIADIENRFLTDALSLVTNTVNGRAERLIPRVIELLQRACATASASPLPPPVGYHVLGPNNNFYYVKCEITSGNQFAVVTNPTDNNAITRYTISSTEKIKWPSSFQSPLVLTYDPVTAPFVASAKPSANPGLDAKFIPVGDGVLSDVTATISKPFCASYATSTSSYNTIQCENLQAFVSIEVWYQDVTIEVFNRVSSLLRTGGKSFLLSPEGKMAGVSHGQLDCTTGTCIAADTDIANALGALNGNYSPGEITSGTAYLVKTLVPVPTGAVGTNGADWILVLILESSQFPATGQETQVLDTITSGMIAFTEGIIAQTDQTVSWVESLYEFMSVDPRENLSIDPVVAAGLLGCQHNKFAQAIHLKTDKSSNNIQLDVHCPYVLSTGTRTDFGRFVNVNSSATFLLDALPGQFGTGRYSFPSLGSRAETHIWSGAHEHWYKNTINDTNNPLRLPTWSVDILPPSTVTNAPPLDVNSTFATLTYPLCRRASLSNQNCDFHGMLAAQIYFSELDAALKNFSATNNILSAYVHQEGIVVASSVTHGSINEVTKGHVEANSSMIEVIQEVEQMRLNNQVFGYYKGKPIWLNTTSIQHNPNRVIFGSNQTNYVPYQLVVAMRQDYFRDDHVNLVRGLSVDNFQHVNYKIMMQPVRALRSMIGSILFNRIKPSLSLATDETISFLWQQCNAHSLAYSFHVTSADGLYYYSVRCQSGARQVVVQHQDAMNHYMLDEEPVYRGKYSWPNYGTATRTIARDSASDIRKSKWFDVSRPSNNTQLKEVWSYATSSASTSNNDIIAQLSYPLCSTTGVANDFSTPECLFFNGMVGVEYSLTQLANIELKKQRGLSKNGLLYTFTESGMLVGSSTEQSSSNIFHTAVDKQISESARDLRLSNVWGRTDRSASILQNRGYDYEIDGHNSVVDIWNTVPVSGTLLSEPLYYVVVLRQDDYDIPAANRPYRKPIHYSSGSVVTPIFVLLCASLVLLLL